jgi:hypothetical protein
MQHLSAPARWKVTLNDGLEVDVWADGVTGLSGAEDLRDHVFECLMDINGSEQGEWEIAGRTPTRSERVLVVVARFPRAAVRSIYSA